MSPNSGKSSLWATLLLLAPLACAPKGEQLATATAAADSTPPSVLLLTLDTTRADALGFESGEAATPSLDRLAAGSIRFEQAYTTAPMTLPAHASMLTGLYPAEHGIHENARYLEADRVLLAERLKGAGYRTVAVVSGLPLGSQFGLDGGFDLYDDSLPPGEGERRASATTDRALALLEGEGAGGSPLFLWVHYFDPHEPYDPPEPFRSGDRSPYYGEISFMDHEIGRLLEAYRQRFADRPWRILVVGDHGEGLGEQGERLHGHLLSQGVMRVPLLVAGDDLAPAVVETPVSVRRIFDTVSGWAGLPSDFTLLDPRPEPVLAEAMKPYLQYGWQPQVMAVGGTTKVIRAGELEVYDLEADPSGEDDLAGSLDIPPDLRQALRDYPLPSSAATSETPALSRETREQLADLGYVSSAGQPPRLRPDAPRPREMAHLFADLDFGSGLFVRQEYAAAIEVFERVLEEDPHNLMVCLRLAVAHSVLGRDGVAERYFERAREIDPASVDVRHYLAMHYLRTGRDEEAAALFESALTEQPLRLPALEGLARIRGRQGRLEETRRLLRRIVELDPDPVAELLELGELSMAVGDTSEALAAFEEARLLQGASFQNDLELGVLYLADGQPEAARDALDRVTPDHPGYPMALFKRAQTSVLLGEAEAADWIRRAEEAADETTAPLIADERLFRDVPR